MFKRPSSSLKSVDNRGQGDCLFYSLAIGLMPEIQRQLIQIHTITINSSLAENQLSQIDIKKTDIKEFDLDKLDQNCILKKLLNYIDNFPRLNIKKEEFILGIMNFEFDYKKIEISKFLRDFNHLLRRILYRHRLHQVQDALAKNTMHENILFMDILFLYHGTPDIATDKLVTQDEKLKKELDIFKKTFGQLDEKELYSLLIPFVLGDEDARKLILDKKTPLHIDVVHSKSLLANLLRKKLEDGRWGTDNDANHLGECLGFRVEVYHEGIVSQKNNEREMPTIKINNFINIHWTTLINLFHKAESIDSQTEAKISTFKIYATDPELTTTEIRNVFKEYDQLIGWKHNRVFAKSIIDTCDVNGCTVQSVMDCIMASVPQHKEAGRLRQCLDYLCYRYSGLSFLEQKNAWNIKLGQEKEDTVFKLGS